MAKNIIEVLEVALAYFIKKTNRVHTHEAYRSALRRFNDYLVDTNLSGISIENFSKLDALYFQDWWVERGNAGKTINCNIGHIRTFFGYYVEREIIPKNPFDGIRKLKEESSVAHAIFTPKMANEIWEHLKKNDIRLYYFTKIIFYTFIRPKEILSLKAKDFDLANGYIRIEASISKNKKTDYVVIPNMLKEILIEMQISKLDLNCIVFSTKLQPGYFIWSRNRVSELHRKNLNELLIPNTYDLYSWKHTGACAAYKAGLGVKEIQQQMRHSESKMTDTYLRSLGLMISENIKNLDW